MATTMGSYMEDRNITDRVQPNREKAPANVPSDNPSAVGERPIVKSYDPYFGCMFDRSESFFRRYESVEQPDEDK